MATSTRKVAAGLWVRAARGSPRTWCASFMPRRIGTSRAVRLAGHDRADLSRSESPGLRLRLRGRRVSRAYRIKQRSSRGAVARGRHSHASGGASAAGYSPLDIKNWIGNGSAGWVKRARPATTRSWPRTAAWGGDERLHAMPQAILPGTVRHQTLTADLPGILGHYQSR